MNISIALATHNGQQYLEKQLQSLLGQSLPPDEIVVSDDHSTDGTIEILDRYSRKHPQIKLLDAKGRGINPTFQNVLAACRGRFIALCDQDDVWDEDKLSHLAAAFTGTTLLAYGRSVLIDSQDRRLTTTVEEYIGFEHYRSGHQPLYFFFSNCISGHAMMIKKELVDCALPIPDSCMYDHWLALTAASKSDIVHVPEAITFHRIHSASTVNNQEKNRETKRRRKKSSKYERDSIQRAALLLRLQQAANEGDGLNSSERDFLSRLLALVTLAEHQIFSLPLFLLLWRRRHELFTTNVLRECRNRSLGGRYHKILDYLLPRATAT